MYSELEKKYPKLTKQEEFNLINRLKINSDDSETYNTILESQRGFIRALVERKYAKKSQEDKEDLVQAGMIGVINALKYFDTQKDKRLYAYAYKYIIHEIVEVCATNNLIKIPKLEWEKINKIKTILGDLTLKLKLSAKGNNTSIFRSFQEGINELKQLTETKNKDLRQITKDTILRLESSLNVGERSINIDIKGLENLYDEVSSHLNVLSPSEFDSLYIEPSICNNSGIGIPEREKHTLDTLKDILLLEIDNFLAWEKKIATLLYYFWPDIKEGIKSNFETNDSLKLEGVVLSEELLQKKKLTQEDIGEILGVKGSRISQIINLETIPILKSRLELVYGIKHFPEDL